jgi:aldehyde:ferredoxin oxidoreductase
MDSEKFEQELPKNLEPLDTDKDLGFHTGLQTGSFPSAGKTTCNRLTHFTNFLNVHST